MKKSISENGFLTLLISTNCKMISEKKITVYTPTYNRAFCLHEVYESLLRQTNKDFRWLIVDDGSKDNTRELVESWISAEELQITYIYQSNKGMLGAHNTAHSSIDTELCVCIDSDDHMPKNGIEIILSLWEKYKQDTSIAGLIGLDCYKNGKIIGDTFEKSGMITNYRASSKVSGDKKYVYRTSVLKRFGPYPEIKGEKFPAQGYLYRLIDRDYNLIAVNEILCVVEYLPDGNSFNKMSSYLKNPKGFMIHRLLLMKMAESYKEKFRNAIHYVSSCLIAKKWKDIFTNEHRSTTILAIPFGILLFFYLKKKKGGAVNRKLNK